MNRPISTFALFCLLMLPWLNPFTFGPTPAVVPWLFTMACACAVLLIVFANRMKTSGQAWPRVAAGSWLAAALISAAMGLGQYFGSSDALAPWVSGAGLGEAYGNLRQRNQFATLMAIGMAALAWWVAEGGSWRTACLAAVLLAIGSAASSSRTGLLQWALLIVFAWRWGEARQHGLRRVLLVAGIAYVFASVALPWLAGLDPMNSGAWARLRSGDQACMGRMTLWSNVLHLIAQKPWLGWGWGGLNYAHFVTLYPSARFCDILDNAHNLPLHLAVELGVPISVAVCSLGLWVVLRMRPWSETVPKRQMAWAVLALIGLHSLLEYPLWYGPFQIAAGLSIWLLWTTSFSTAKPAKSFALFLPLAPVVFASAAIVFAAVCGYTAWDYWRASQMYVAHAERSNFYRDDTLEKVRGTWLFKSQVEFAELTTMPLTPDNADYTFELARQLLHFSPEPRVIEKLIDSAVMLGRDEDAAFYLIRYRVAFPAAHAQWKANSGRNIAP